jgi:hypothetical protein
MSLEGAAKTTTAIGSVARFCWYATPLSIVTMT